MNLVLLYLLSLVTAGHWYHGEFSPEDDDEAPIMTEPLFPECGAFNDTLVILKCDVYCACLRNYQPICDPLQPPSPDFLCNDESRSIAAAAAPSLLMGLGVWLSLQ